MSVEDEGSGSRPAGDERVGAAWTMDEMAVMVRGLRDGRSVQELAVMVRRTPGGVAARLARMIPTEERVHRFEAANWLVVRFGVEPGYDWRAVLADRLAHRRQRSTRTNVLSPDDSPGVSPDTLPHEAVTSESPEPRRRRAAPVVVPADQILEIWQDVVGAILQPERAGSFLAHPDSAIIGRYPEDRVRAAARQLHRRTGELRLGRWVRECAWDGGGTAAVTWGPLAEAEPDAIIAVRDLITAAVGGLTSARSRRILTERLGLHGEPARTLHAIGADLDITRERVRQLQEQAFGHFRQHRQPPKPAEYAGDILAGVVTEAAGAGSGLAQTLSVLAEAVAPAAPPRVVVRLLAALTGGSPQVANNLAAEVTTVRALRRAETARAARDAAAVSRAGQRVDRMLADADRPTRPAAAPERSLFTPLRTPEEREGVGTWPSKTLGRDVVYESNDELRMIKTLDSAPRIAWFCEQPVAIGYTFDGRERTYYPDFLITTDDDRCVLVEVKPQIEMAMAINLAKTAAARAFCAHHGWGYLCTDGTRSLRQLENLPVPEPAARELTDMLHRDGAIMWADTTSIRTAHAITSLHIAALVIQRGWDFRLGPYRITEPGHATRGHRRPRRTPQ